MSLTSSASILTSSLMNFQSAIQLTSNNIANASTLGYSREVANFSENTPAYLGSMSFGTGSSISSVSRLRDVYLDFQIRSQLTQLGFNDTVNSSMQQLAAFFPDIASPSAANGISNLLSNFYSAWSALAASPASNAAKQVVITDGVGLANQLRQTMQNLANFRNTLNTQVSDTVASVNSLINQIAADNTVIKVNPFSSATIQDQRDQAMKNLSQLIDAQFTTAADGTINVFFNKGSLVSGGIATNLSLITGLPDPNTVKVGYPAGSAASDVSGSINGGTLGGLLYARDSVVKNAIFSVQAIGSGLIENTNLIYHAAKDASGAHSNFFTGNNGGDILVNPILSGSTTGAPLLSSFSTLSTAGDMALAMAGAQNDFVASYAQSLNPIAASYSSSLAINVQPAVSPTPFSVSGTIHIDLSSSSAAMINWDNTQSLATIARNITTALAGAGTAVYDETTRKFTILSSQPISLYDATGNFSKVTQLRTFLNSATNINANIDPTFNSGTGAEALNSNNALLRYFDQALSSGTYSVNNSNINWKDTQSINTIATNVFSGSGSTVFAYFDTTTQRVIEFKNIVAPTVGNPLTSFTGADAVGNFAKLAAIQAPSSLGNTYAGIETGITQQTALASAQLQATQGVVTNLQNLQDAKSKVNLDVEMTQAMQYRNAYEASLRVISVIDDMLNVLINHTSASTSIDTSSSSQSLG